MSYTMNISGQSLGAGCPQGHGLEVIEKGPQTLSARLGFAPVDTTQTGQDLRGQELG